MPPTVQKSGLFEKYKGNLDKSVKAHAQDETTFGFQRLPGGINNGIAKLVECKFAQVEQGKQNAGEYYFRAAGVVVSPPEVMTKDGVMKIAGMQTSIMEMVCDTQNSNGQVTTQDEHIANILNEFRKLGVDTTNVTGATLEATAAALKAAGPYFKFSTNESKAVLNPDGTEKYAARVWERWHGSKGLEDYVPPEGADVVDETGEATGGDAGDAGNDNVEYTDTDDLNSLAEAADGGNDDAIKKLTDLANNAGITDVQISEAEDWKAVVKLFGHGGEELETPADEPWEPKKEEVYKYALKDAKGNPVKDPKTKKPKKVEVEVITVNKPKKTVDVKNLDDGKTTYKGVKWDDLIAE